MWMFFNSFGYVPRMEMLGHILTLCMSLLCNAQWSSKVTGMLQSVKAEGSCCLSNISVLSFFFFNHSCSGESDVISHCSFNLHIS
jgi:hypothetical protein